MDYVLAKRILVKSPKTFISGVRSYEYDVAGVRFEREVIASYPDQVIVVRLRASRPGALDFRTQLSRSEAATVGPHGQNELLLLGQMWNGSAWQGMKFAARVRVPTQGGKVSNAGVQA